MGFAQVFYRTLEDVLESTAGRLQNGPVTHRFRRLDPAEFPMGLDHWDSFYGPEPAAPPVDCTLLRRYRDGSRRVRLAFPSPLPSPYPENNRVFVTGREHLAEAARGSLIVLHGHKMPGFSPLEGFAAPTYREGFNIYYLALPYHMQRRPTGSAHGELMVSGDLGLTLLAFRQAVADVRALASLLLAQNGLPVALLGLSLGAFVADLAAVVDGRFSAVVSALGGGSFARVVTEGLTLRTIQKDLRRGGVTPAELEQDWALLSPARLHPRIPIERILLVAGRYDPTVTPDNVELLSEAWGHPTLHWYPTGHTTLFAIPGWVGRDIARFLSG